MTFTVHQLPETVGKLHTKFKGWVRAKTGQDVKPGDSVIVEAMPTTQGPNVYVKPFRGRVAKVDRTDGGYVLMKVVKA